jgi:uncharacterized double-CXXCG motif protein
MDLFILDQSCGGWLDGRHQWHLPGILCPLEGPTGTTGLVYPCVDPSKKEWVSQLNHNNFPMDEFRTLVERVRPSLPSGTPLEPGLAFGPAVGRVVWRPKELAWLQSALFISPELHRHLEKRRVRLPKACAARFTYKGKKVRYDELQIEPTIEIAPGTRPKVPDPCPACGGLGQWYPKRLVVKRSSVTSRMDLFRLKGRYTVVLGTSRFVDAVEERGFKIASARVALK